MSDVHESFLSGVVEGFYGRPWNARQRHQLFGWMRRGDLNAYLYSPKDDLKHRGLWRLPYSEMEAAELGALIRDAERHGIQFFYGIGPGLDIRYASEADRGALERKIFQVLELGCRNFAVAFDDIPAVMRPEDAAVFGSFAEAQASVANELAMKLRRRIPESRVLFCPTQYCGRMVGQDENYLRILGERLDLGISVFWTGPEIISDEISVESIEAVAGMLRRKPVLWDNLYANDYDYRRAYMGPYMGRSKALQGAVSGILLNPNCQFELNFVPVRCLGLFLGWAGDWQPRKAYTSLLDEWLPAFGGREGDLRTREDLEWLGDFFYLPYRHGERAGAYLEDARALLRTPPARWGEALGRFRKQSGEVMAMFDRLLLITQRDLLYSIYSQIWELKEEIALILDYIKWREMDLGGGAPFVSGTHRYPVYRGGMAAELQRLLPMRKDGNFGVCSGGAEEAMETDR